MGKKYIVEIGRLERLYKASISAKGMPNMTWLSPEVDLTPYTEPDLEQVRKEAYEDGYKTAKVQCNIQAEKDMREVGERHYQRGLADAKCGYENGFENGMIVAWEAARKIIHMPEGDLLNIFTECYSAVCTALQVVLKYDASECIEKIQAYEQEEIKVGDEVELKCGVRPAIYMQGTKGSDEIYLLFNDGSCGVHSKSEIERKTDRHFHEIATILENMRGEQDG